MSMLEAFQNFFHQRRWAFWIGARPRGGGGLDAADRFPQEVALLFHVPAETMARRGRSQPPWGFQDEARILFLRSDFQSARPCAKIAVNNRRG